MNTEKIGILTFHKTTNYGAVLQAYALQKIIEKNGGDSIIIDYQNESILHRESFIRPKLLLPIRNFLCNCKDYVLKAKKRKVIKEFIGKYLKITSRKYSVNNIASTNNVFSTFIVGSDMVWNMDITNNDLHYFLDFVPPEKRFSYAASIGIEDFTCQYELSLNELKNFRTISVRELQGKTMLNERSIQSRVDLDPTLLLNRDDWRILSNTKQNLVEGKYLLLYFLDEAGKMIEIARILSKKYGIKIVLISDKKERQYDDIEVFQSVSVETFLALIDRASLVFTGSFHGLIFSINYHTNFLYYGRANTSRMDSIVSIIGATDKKIQSIEEIKDFEWDFEKYDRLLEVEKNKSISYLKDIINHEYN